MLWCESVAPLGEPVVPLVYWMLIGSSKSSSGHSISARRAAQQLVRLVAEEDHVLEVGQVAADLLDHRAVVRALELRGGDQRLAAGVAQRVGELGRAVGGVDVDEDDPELRRGELDVDPLGAVRRPDAEAVALAQAEAGERARRPVDVLPELAVGQPHALVGHHRAPRGRGRPRPRGRSWPRSSPPAAGWSRFPASTTAPSSLLSGLRSTSGAAASQPGAAATRARAGRRHRDPRPWRTSASAGSRRTRRSRSARGTTRPSP